MRSLADLPARHRVVLCDVWGCVHDGVALFPGVADLLGRWRAQGRVVLLLTNAPRPAAAVERQLAGLGLGPEGYDAVVTSGEAGLAALDGGGTVGFIGTEADRRLLAEAGVDLAPGPSGGQVICTGLTPDRSTVGTWEAELAAMRDRGATLLCFNPDLAVVRGGVVEPCAGALAARYEAMGGDVRAFGKPHAAIYDHALEVASERAGRPVRRDEVVAVGDGLRTDMLGAARAGLPFVLVTGGVDAEAARRHGDALLDRFRAEHGLAEFAPVAVVDRLC